MPNRSVSIPNRTAQNVSAIGIVTIPFSASARKYALCLRRILHPNVYGEALWFLIAIRRGVHAHQYLVADYQSRVDDLATPFRGYLIRNGRALVGNHGFDFAAEALLVELERSLAVAVEMKVGIQLHGTSPWGCKRW